MAHASKPPMPPPRPLKSEANVMAEMFRLLMELKERVREIESKLHGVTAAEHGACFISGCDPKLRGRWKVLAIERDPAMNGEQYTIHLERPL